MKLEKAFKDAGLDTSRLRKYDLNRRRGEFASVYHATCSSLALGLLAFLRGPANGYEQRSRKAWRDSAIDTLVQKGALVLHVRICRIVLRRLCATARGLLRDEETRGEREAAAARLRQMDALRSKLNAKMEAKMCELPDWSWRELWARTHAKEQSKLYK